jgi:hypothetical protein
MNQAFTATYQSYPGVGNGGVRVPFKFVLAKAGVGCVPVTGITRYDGTVIPGYTSVGYDYATTGSYLRQLAWPTESYLNIFVVNKVNSGQAAGLSTSKGIFLNRGFAHVGSGVIVHELGHYFGLDHVFFGDNNGNNCPPNNDCHLDGDGICDTEPCIRYPPGVQYYNLCTGTMSNFIQDNFMNYSNYALNRFTEGQKEKMVFTLQNMPLGHSLKGESPLTDVKAATCSTFAQNIDIYKAGGPISVKIADIKHHSPYLYNENMLAWVDNTCQYRTEMKTGHTYTIDVNTFFTESTLSVYIDYNNDAIFQPGELACSNPSGKMFLENISIPLNAVLGKPLRMRVIVDTVTGSNSLEPCGQLINGQAEDYVVIIKDGTAINNVTASSGIKLYPNPANDLLFIENGGHVASVQLFATDGQMIKEYSLKDGQTSLNVSNIAGGVYFLRFKEGEAPRTLRFVKY